MELLESIKSVVASKLQQFLKNKGGKFLSEIKENSLETV